MLIGVRNHGLLTSPFLHVSSEGEEGIKHLKVKVNNHMEDVLGVTKVEPRTSFEN